MLNFGVHMQFCVLTISRVHITHSPCIQQDYNPETLISCVLVKFNIENKCLPRQLLECYKMEFRSAHASLEGQLGSKNPLAEHGLKVGFNLHLKWEEVEAWDQCLL
jgi:hypothetical protein